MEEHAWTLLAATVHDMMTVTASKQTHGQLFAKVVAHIRGRVYSRASMHVLQQRNDVQRCCVAKGVTGEHKHAVKVIPSMQTVVTVMALRLYDSLKQQGHHTDAHIS